jgi:hypothetical protein
MSRVKKCKFCGNLYKFMSLMVGDQSCCQTCREKKE